MVMVPVTTVVMALVLTFFVLVSGLDNLSAPRRDCNWWLPIIINEFTPTSFSTPPRVGKTESSPQEATNRFNNRDVWGHTATQDLPPFVYATGFGKFHGVPYGVLVEMMMFVLTIMIIVVVATVGVGRYPFL